VAPYTYRRVLYPTRSVDLVWPTVHGWRYRRVHAFWRRSHSRSMRMPPQDGKGGGAGAEGGGAGAEGGGAGAEGGQGVEVWLGGVFPADSRSYADRSEDSSASALSARDFALDHNTMSKTITARKITKSTIPAAVRPCLVAARSTK